MFNFDFSNDIKILRKKDTKKHYSRKYRKRTKKYIRINPTNGQTPDCVDMMYRNRDRFNFGLPLNEE